MIDRARTYSDEVLTAFLDGEAAPDIARAIETALQTDEVLGERLMALDIPKDEIAAQFDAMMIAAPPMPELPEPKDMPAINTNAPVDEPARRRSGLGGVLWLGTGIAAGIAMAFAYGLGQPAVETAQAPPRGWIGSVAAYQVLYTPATLSKADPTAAASLGALSDRLGLDLSGLAQVDGLQLRRAQLLGFNGKDLIQLAYALPDGTPVAICILRSGKEARGARFQEVEGLQSADWNTGAHGILVIGGEDAERIRGLVPKVEALL